MARVSVKWEEMRVELISLPMLESVNVAVGTSYMVVVEEDRVGCTDHVIDVF